MGLIDNVTTKENKYENRTKFYVNIDNGSGNGSPLFTPTKGFAHMTSKEALGVLKNADVSVTKESKGYVNFSLSFMNRTIGFINFYDNPLSDNSLESEQEHELGKLVVKLGNLVQADIQTPVTKEEADSILKELM